MSKLNSYFDELRKKGYTVEVDTSNGLPKLVINRKTGEKRTGFLGHRKEPVYQKSIEARGDGTFIFQMYSGLDDPELLKPTDMISQKLFEQAPPQNIKKIDKKYEDFKKELLETGRKAKEQLEREFGVKLEDI